MSDGPGRDLAPEEARPHLARVLGVAPEALGRVRTAQVLRRRSGRRIVTWRTDAGRAVLVVGAGGPRRGCVLSETADGHPVAGFRVEDDPRLPGLALLDHPEAVPGVAPGLVRAVHRHRHRPLSRAVLRVDLVDGGRVWVKAVRPSDAAELVDVHRAVAAVAAAPEVVGADVERGLLVLADLGESDLRSLVRSSPERLPPPWSLLELVDGLAAADVSRPVQRRAPLDALDRTGDRVAGLLPWLADRVAEVVEGIRGLVAEGSTGPEVVVHGDLHAAQLVARPDGLALLDLDDVGRGHAVDDAGRMLGHLACTVLPLEGASAAGWADALAARFRDRHDEAALRARVAAVVLGLATGPHRVQREDWRERAEERVALAEGWLR